MIKQENIYQQDDKSVYRTSQENFYLNDQQRNNINKRLPVGFSLIKITDLPIKSTFNGPINYVGGKQQIRIASEQLAKQFAIQTQVTGAVRKEGRGQQKGLRCGQLPQGRSKQGQKIKNILQRFRKHQKFILLSQHLTRLGFASALLQIEAQNRKNIHTIQSFKQRLLYLFNQALNVTYEPDKVGLISQMIDQVNFLVDIAQKSQFANSLFSLQKSIDKVTRQISQIKETGSFYFRKRKRNEKNYEQKQLLYLAELMKALPPREMVGVIEILEEKPFNQITLEKVQFDLNLLKNKKIRQIEFYVKKKLSNYFKSVQRKNQKRQAKRKAELGEVSKSQNKQKQQNENGYQRQQQQTSLRNLQFAHGRRQMEQNYRENYVVKKQAQIEYIFQEEENEDDQDQRRGRSEVDPSLESVDRPQRSEYQDDFFNDRAEENYFGESSRQHQQPSIQESEANRQPPADNLEFQQPNLFLDKSYVQQSKIEQVQRVEQEHVFQSSDSSYITDQDDSEF